MTRDDSRHRRARIVREGVADSYKKLMSDLMAGAFGSDPSGAGPERARYQEAIEKFAQIIHALRRMESAIERLRKRDSLPSTMQKISLIRSKAADVRMAAVRAGDRIILALSKAIATQLCPPDD